MAVLDGCESKYRTPVPEERTCPKCGKIVEVFTVRGRIMEDAKCPCGYVFSIPLLWRKKKKNKSFPRKRYALLCAILSGGLFYFSLSF